MFKKTVITIALVIAGAAASLFTIYALIPADVMEEMVTGALKRSSGVVVSGETFRKLYPAGFETTGVTISTPARPKRHLRAGRISARLSLASLLTARLRADLDADFGGGVVSGPVTVSPAGAHAELAASAINLSSLITAIDPAAGLLVTGLDGVTLGGRVVLTFPRLGCPSGTVAASGSGGPGETALRIIGMRVPIGTVTDAGLDAVISDCVVQLEGAWVDATGLSLRVTGTVTLGASPRQSPLDLTVEVVPKNELASNDAVRALLAPYMRSSNFYSIAVRGTMGAPVIRAD